MIEVKHTHTLAPEVLALLAGLINGGEKVQTRKTVGTLKKVEEPDADEPDADEPDADEPEEITKDSCRELAAEKKEKGKGPKIIALLGTYGVKSITNLPDKKVKEFYAKLQKL